jgi:hypothetical protein
VHVRACVCMCVYVCACVCMCLNPREFVCMCTARPLHTESRHCRTPDFPNPNPCAWRRTSTLSKVALIPVSSNTSLSAAVCRSSPQSTRPGNRRRRGSRPWPRAKPRHTSRANAIHALYLSQQMQYTLSIYQSQDILPEQMQYTLSIYHSKCNTRSLSIKATTYFQSKCKTRSLSITAVDLAVPTNVNDQV